MGIDVQSEYIFNDLEPFLKGVAPCTAAQTTSIKKTAERQTCITDTFKERKRKINPDAIEKSKEKRKRGNALIQNFNYLKESFQAASKNVNQSMNKQRQNGESLKKNAAVSSKSCSTMSNSLCAVNINSAKDKLIQLGQNTCYEEMDGDEFIDEEKIDSILNEIEKEMGKTKTLSNTTSLSNNTYFRERNLKVQNPSSTKLTPDSLKSSSVQHSITKSNSYKTLNALRKPKSKTPKSNYNFIDLLERKLNISDDNDKSEVVQKDNGFSDTIKSQIQKYLTKIQTKTSIHDINIKKLIDKPDDELKNDEDKTVVIQPDNMDSEILNSPMHSPCSRYEIKEILGGKNIIASNSNIQSKNDNNFIYNQNYKDCNIKPNYNNKDALSHCDSDMKTLTSLPEIHNMILGDEDSINNIDNELKEEDLDDTFILNVDEGDEKLKNNENDRICVTKYTLNKGNDEYRNYVADVNPDITMISPTEVSDDLSNRKNTDMNNQCSNTNKQNSIAEYFVTKGSHNNTSNILVDNERCESDTAAKDLCSDLDIKNRTQMDVNDRASHNKTLATEDIEHKLYESTKVDALAKTPWSDIAMENINEFVENNRPWHDKPMSIKTIDRNLYDSTKNDTLVKIACSDTKYRNELVNNKKALHDKTRVIDNIGRSTRSNQAECNKSICYPPLSNDLLPSYDLMNNSPNNSSNSSNNTDINKQKENYVRRYTYSTSKVDVCTKQTPEYCVQVIKKVKMDLDITAIVSRKHNSSQNYEPDREEASSNNKRMKMIELPKHENTFQNITNDNNKILNTFNNEIKNTLKVNLTSAKLSKPEFSAIKNVVMLPNITFEQDESTSKGLQNIIKSQEHKKRDSPMNKKQSNSNVTGIQISEKITHEELEEQENQTVNLENTSEKFIESQSGVGTFTRDNKIKNVLQKYSKILA